MLAGESRVLRQISDLIASREIHGLGWCTATVVDGRLNLVFAQEVDGEDPIIIRYDVTVKEV